MAYIMQRRDVVGSKKSYFKKQVHFWLENTNQFSPLIYENK
jgi:hypothetical protein